MIWHDKKITEILKEFSVNPDNGLSDAEAEKRLLKFGKNAIKSQKPSCFFKKLLNQFKDFMIIILLIAAAISFVTSIIDGNADYIDSIIILCIVFFNAIIGVIQENRAEKSIESLKKISSPTALVRRDGNAIVIDAENLVPGDIIILQSGNRVPADCRIISSVSLICDESMLTGESEPVEKKSDFICNSTALLAERKNMLWAGSMIISGKSEAVVCQTGMNTEMGYIASLILSSDSCETPLQKKLSNVGRILGISALLICSIIFVIGLFFNIPPFEMFMTAVSLAVAAIPEGLPAIVTIMLAIGVQRMASQGSIMRNLPTIETLGSASVICSDKTGTLTQNKMTVTKIYSKNKNYLLRLAALCSDFNTLNPTENAIIEAFEQDGFRKKDLDKRFPRLSEIPFNSERKLMSVTFKNSGKIYSVAKGAPDIVVNLCTHFFDGEKSVPMTAQTKKLILKENNEMAINALRVIAVAFKECASSTPIEKSLTFVGLIGMEDPPRPEVFDAVKTCKTAGITPIMITGDHLSTASAIAKKTGILTHDKLSMNGDELDVMSQNELEKKISQYSVFARVSPAHKVRIVKAWQKSGAIVAMTGDGVNDAPALKAADIGCSMGLSGTDVAKNASDMILTDDNFATIVSAVKQGRCIFSNIKKAIQFLLSSNIGEILTVFLGLIFNRQAPLLAIQLLWVNLITDSLPAIALGLDPPDKYLMQNKPYPANKSIFADGMWFSILLEGAMIGALALLSFVIGNIYFDITVARTMAFCTLSISQLVHSFNTRSEHSVFSVGIFSNKYLVGSFVIGIFLQCLVVSQPMLAGLFKITPLSFVQWLIVAILSIMPLIVVELQKLFSRKFLK